MGHLGDDRPQEGRAPQGQIYGQPGRRGRPAMKRPSALELLKAAEKGEILSVLSVPSHKNVPEFSPFDEGQGPREGVERTDKTDNTSLTLTIGRQNPRNFGTFIPAPTDKTDETRASAKIYAFIPRRSDKTDETLRPALAPIIAAYGDVEILIRPATPAPL